MKTRGPVAAILLTAHVDADGSHVTTNDSEAIEAAIAALGRAEIDQLVVVLGENAGTLAFEFMAETTTVRREADWATGLQRGLRGGLASLQPDAAAIVVATTDIDSGDGRALRRIVRRYGRGEAPAFALELSGRPRLPVLIDRSLRGALDGYEDGSDLAGVVADHPAGCVLVAPGPATPNPTEA